MAGLNKLLEHLPACADQTEPRLFFVVPKGAYDEGFKTQQPFTTTKGIVLVRKLGETNHTRQFVMCVSFCDVRFLVRGALSSASAMPNNPMSLG